MTERTGVFICECGPNIKDAMDVPELVRFASGLPGVVVAMPHSLLCADDGKGMIGRIVREQKLTGVVVAACSPKEHEKTFRAVLAEAGVNPYMLQIANIREQCAWVTDDFDEATRKAKRIISAAVGRVAHHEPLTATEIDCKADVLVVGAGVAGMSAALTLAQKGRRVFVVEKEPWVGGMTVRYEDVFPGLECASCMLEPMIDELLHHERIDVLTGSEVVEVLGTRGNYTAHVRTRARSVDLDSCIGCGVCIEACPAKQPDPQIAGMGERSAMHIPFAGVLPNVPTIDRESCLRSSGSDCEACVTACPFGSVMLDQEDTERTFEVGAVVVANGFESFDATVAVQYGLGEVSDVRTAVEFERMLSSNGPTSGKVVLESGEEPDTIALIHCVGSRSAEFNNYCSGVCCSYMLKFAHLIRKQLPDATILDIYADHCLPGTKGEHLLAPLQSDERVEFLRMKGPGCAGVEASGAGAEVTYVSAAGTVEKRQCDMVVLAPGMEGPRDAADLAAMLEIAAPNEATGFFESVHSRLAPVSTTSEGVFVAGAARGPCDIESAVAQGQAAAGKVLSSLVPGERLTLEVAVASIEGEQCSSCGMCISVCPFSAIRRDEEAGHSVVDETLCRGCGTCAATCPSGAATARHFNDAQVYAEIRGVLR